MPKMHSTQLLYINHFLPPGGEQSKFSPDFLVQVNSRIELSNSSDKEVENRVGDCVIVMEPKLIGWLKSRQNDRISQTTFKLIFL